MYKKWIILYASIFLLLSFSTCYSKELRNIALGMPYKVSIAPNYPTCTGDGDKTELTDGEKNGSFFKNASTILWYEPEWKKTIEVEITIDLEYEKEFEEIRIYTRNGSGPDISSVNISTSGEDKKFKEITVYSNPQRQSIFYQGIGYTISIPILKTKGRYVKLLLVGRTAPVCDEIEVLSSSSLLLEIKSKKQEKNGSYIYVVNATDTRGKEITLQGCTIWKEVLFERTQKLDAKDSAIFTFSLPSELCHLLVFDLKDENGVVIERCLEKIGYTLPVSTVKVVEEMQLGHNWLFQMTTPTETFI